MKGLSFSAGLLLLVLCACEDRYFKNDYEDNSPTSGKLKVFYDEGLHLHISNQAYTFQSQYPNASLEIIQSTDNEAVEALYNDSCKAIVISRQLTQKEKKAFESKNLIPKYSAIAKSGVALITNIATPVKLIGSEQVLALLGATDRMKDSAGNEIKVNVLIDKKNSAVMHYLLDSLLKKAAFAPHCAALESSVDAINYVAENKNAIAFIDFAWLSDVDDSLFKANKNKIRFLAVQREGNNYEYPSQSSFKLNTYPYTRTIYLYRRTGEFTLAKGFESFVAGPKGQITFLKQGLLPTRQQERTIEVNMEPEEAK